ncbi:hypothetical protein ACIBSV_23520 [Embleya sp. NPDC050154]|uniref:hypothetical protein n=1 Tax=Embleya sp. NPDC050154 TaxID=3363988 RepID=UPI0037A3B101
MERGPDDESDRLTLEMVAELLAGDVAEHVLSSDRDHTLIEARFEFSGTVFRLWTIVKTPTLAVVPIGACDE